ncbi:MAG: 16S rRNA (guanine(966)-N(2))-methyltransferase RsmD [Spartobacteria bacterium]|nr:16S rRNA (guanine(966)-N(2))-methyltransferase RsmD [Spartobacteria bacterium]
MRLTGGDHGGRLLKVPAAGTRPTQDKVRAAVCSSLAAAIPGARVLDLFAGTGALGLEAWSRGAAWVEWVENGPPALRVLRANLAALRVPPEAGRVLAADVFRLLAAPCAGAPFDLALADPPYAEAQEKNWLPQLAAALARNGWIRPGGVFVFETEGKDPPPALPGWRLARDKTYGATRIWIWVRESGESGGPAGS